MPPTNEGTRTMKSLTTLALSLVLVACGSAEDEAAQTQPQPAVQVAFADLTEAQPTADIGFAGCRSQATLDEVNARTDAQVVLGGQVLTYRYNTQDGAYYLSEDGRRSLQVFERQGFVRVSISCPL
jgi:uncharacterized lipoprotein YajG